MVQSCPYSSKYPAASDIFVGRQVEVRNLLFGLRRNPPGSIGIRGGSQIGKTSLWQQAVRQFESEEHDPWLLIDIDADSIPGTSAMLAVEHMEKVLWTKSQALLGDLSEDDVLREAPPQPRASDRLQALLRTVDRRQRFSKFVFVIDKADRLARMVDWEDLSRELAVLLSSPHDVPRNVGLILIGSPNVFEIVESKVSPLANLLEYIQLGNLSDDETRELIQRPVGEKVPRDVVNLIIAETGGHPFLTQYIMEQLFWRLDGHLEDSQPEMISEIVKDLSEERQYIRRWFDRLPKLAHTIFGHIVRSSVRYDDLFRMMLSVPDEHGQGMRPARQDEIDKALKALLGQGLVALYTPLLDGDYPAYRPAGSLCTRYFRQYVEQPLIDIR